VNRLELKLTVFINVYYVYVYILTHWRMYMCACLHTRTQYTHTHTHIYIYKMYICMCIYTCIHKYVYCICMYVVRMCIMYVCTRMYVCLYVYVPMHLCVYIYVCIYYTGCFKKRFTTLKAYRNLYRGHTQRFELSKCSKTHRVLPLFLELFCKALFETPCICMYACTYLKWTHHTKVLQYYSRARHNTYVTTLTNIALYWLSGTQRR
jgi:hypothetical protein